MMKVPSLLLQYIFNKSCSFFQHIRNRKVSRYNSMELLYNSTEIEHLIKKTDTNPFKNSISLKTINIPKCDKASS